MSRSSLTPGGLRSLAATRPTVQNAPMTERIPTLSLRAADSDRFVHDLGQAYADHGFVIIADHGIPQPLIDRFLGIFKAFFAWPEADKRRYHVPGGCGARWAAAERLRTHLEVPSSRSSSHTRFSERERAPR